MTKRSFTDTQVYLLVFVVIVAIAFLETSEPVWTIGFFKEIVLKVVIYGGFVEIIVIALASFLSKD